MRVVEVGGIVISSVCIHVKCCSGRDRGSLVRDVANGDARETNRDDGPISKYLFVKRGDVGDFLFLQTFGPGVAVWIGFLDFCVGTFLDGGALGSAEDGETHD